MAQNPLWQKLDGGDRRSLGRVDEVIADVLADPALFPPLIDGMTADNPPIRMRSADAMEKLTLAHPGWLSPYKARLLDEVARVEQQEVRWHVAQLIPRLALKTAERRNAVQILEAHLNDPSKMVRTFAMQALAELAEQDVALRPSVIEQLQKLARTGSPAMRSRGRKLLARLSNR